MIDGDLKVLMVNPSINLKKNIQFVKQVCKVGNAQATIVCGRDERLFNKLTELQGKGEIQSKVKILGFVKNMNELLADCHILMTKAGPNMLLEGTRSGSAVIVTGHIPGQEAHNYEYITKNGYGFKCENPKKLYSMLTEQLKTGKIKEYLKNVLKADCNDGAKIIVETIDEYLSGKN